MATKMTACEIIQETYDYYTKDPDRRSFESDTISGQGCRYNYKGKHCAVGRCLMLKWRRQGKNFPGNNKGIQDMLMANDWTADHENDLILDDMLMLRYRGHADDLWEELQTLHDNDVYWDEPNKRITADGHGRFKIMMRDWEGK